MRSRALLLGAAVVAAIGGVALATDGGDVSPMYIGNAAIRGPRMDYALETPVGKHFTVADVIRSSTARARGIDNRLTPAALVNARLLAEQILDPIWDALGPIEITSWFRSPALNAAIGGSRTSQHMLGTAADIKWSQAAAPDFARAILRSGAAPVFDQMIGYSEDNGGQIHISTGGRSRGQVLWSSSKKSYREWSPLAPEGQRLGAVV